ncbi:MAG: redoxin domain-containing protein, partial [Solirubrobacterales bacterium]
MLAAGETAPDFTLADQDGTPVTLSDLRGQTVVLYFYLRFERGKENRRPRELDPLGRREHHGQKFVSRFL